MSFFYFILGYVVACLLVWLRCFVIMQTYEWHVMKVLELPVFPISLFIGVYLIFTCFKGINEKKQEIEEIARNTTDSLSLSLVVLSLSWIVETLK